MESDLKYHQKPTTNSGGLTRYSSDPSSVFSNLIDGELVELTEFLNGPSSPETERIFARFLSSSKANETPIGAVNRSSEAEQTQMIDSIIEEKPVIQHSFYQVPNQQHLDSASNYRPVSSIGIDRLPPAKNSGVGGGGNNSNLLRHSSSPANFLAYLNVDPGYPVPRGIGDYASKPHTSAGRMNPISEVGNSVASTSSGGYGENHSTDYPISFLMSPLDDNSSLMSADSSNRLKKEDRTFPGLNMSDSSKIGDGVSRPPRLVHHVSLPANPSAELSSIEKFLQYSDSVPCKIRAKRGMATHPRSIAERVRRTKISERMRKLQELVPNMDKQTNTADMLDLAVDYIKELQRQHKTLSDDRAKCTCAIAD